MAPIGKGVTKKTRGIEYPFEHVEVTNYALDGVSVHPVITSFRHHS
jgi:hypothetical protein